MVMVYSFAAQNISQVCIWLVLGPQIKPNSSCKDVLRFLANTDIFCFLNKVSVNCRPNCIITASGMILLATNEIMMRRKTSNLISTSQLCVCWNSKHFYSCQNNCHFSFSRCQIVFLLKAKFERKCSACSVYWNSSVYTFMELSSAVSHAVVQLF